MKIYGLSQKLRNVYLADFVYSATGEGYTHHAKLIYCDNPINLKEYAAAVGFGETMPAKLISCVVERQFTEFSNQYYLDNNPEFDARFLRAFGADAWTTFWKLMPNHMLDLEVKMHYNLS